MGFKERLKQARKSMGLTQEQLGGLIGVAKSTVTGYEKGNSEPDMAKTSKLIEVLRIDANFLFDYDGDDTFNLIFDKSESDIKKRLIKNLDAMNEFGHEKLLEYSELLLKDDQFLVCDSAGVGTA